MYYLLRACLYLFSLLPFPIIYLFSDAVQWLLYYVIGYRREVIMGNLKHSFPEKGDEELKRIAREFYRNFCDTLVETIKMLSMSRKEAARRIASDFTLLEKYYAEGKSVQLYAGHFMNWEYVDVCIPAFQPFTFLGVYMPLSSPVMNRMMLHLRSRFGTVLLKAGQMKEAMTPWLNRQYLLGLGADQSPGDPSHACWIYFMHQPTAFIRGPWERACRLKQPTVFLKISKVRRGYYQFSVLPFEEDPSVCSPEQMVRKFAAMLETLILENPSLYLWSHRRWKKKWSPAYHGQWADLLPPPAE